MFIMESAETGGGGSFATCLGQSPKYESTIQQRTTDAESFCGPGASQSETTYASPPKVSCLENTAVAPTDSSVVTLNIQKLD